MISRRKAIFFGMSAVLGLAPIGILIKDQLDQKEEVIRSTSSFEVMCGNLVRDAKIVIWNHSLEDEEWLSSGLVDELNENATRVQDIFQKNEIETELIRHTGKLQCSPDIFPESDSELTVFLSYSKDRRPLIKVWNSGARRSIFKKLAGSSVHSFCSSFDTKIARPDSELSGVYLDKGAQRPSPEEIAKYHDKKGLEQLEQADDFFHKLSKVYSRSCVKGYDLPASYNHSAANFVEVKDREQTK